MKKILSILILISSLVYAQEQTNSGEVNPAVMNNQCYVLSLREELIEQYKLSYIKEYHRKRIASRILIVTSAAFVAGGVGYLGYQVGKDIVAWFRKNPTALKEASSEVKDAAADTRCAPMSKVENIDERVKILEGDKQKLDEREWYLKALDSLKSMPLNMMSIITSSVLTALGQRMVGEVLLGPGDLQWYCEHKVTIFALLEALQVSAKELEDSSHYDNDRIHYHRACIQPLCRALAQTMEKLIAFLEFKLSEMPSEQAVALGLDILPRYLVIYTNNFLSKVEFCIKSENNTVVAKDLLFLVDDFNAELKHAINKCMGI
ncbi:MAG: hypothetical protein ACOYT8_06140 [Candidatus Dependentiae bacterium]